MKFQAKLVSGKEGFVALFHHTSADNYCFFHVGELGRKEIVSGFVYGGNEGGESKTIPTELGRWYDVLVKVRDVEYWCYLDGQELFHKVDKRFTKGLMGLATWDANVRFRDISVTTPEGKALWKGLPDLPSE